MVTLEEYIESVAKEIINSDNLTEEILIEKLNKMYEVIRAEVLFCRDEDGKKERKLLKEVGLYHY